MSTTLNVNKTQIVGFGSKKKKKENVTGTLPEGRVDLSFASKNNSR